METPENRTRATFRWDTARGAGQGALDALRNTFLLLVAIRVFHAPDLIKAFLPASVFMGMLLTPLTLALTAGRRVRMGLLGAVYAAVTGCALIASAFASNLFIYLGLAAGAQIVSAQWIPLMTHIYASNYNERHRGALFSATFLLVSLVGAAVSYAGGWLLDLDLSYWKIVFVLTGTAVLMSAVAMLRMPTSPMTRIAARNPWESISLAWKDKTFGAVLASWFIMGLGNLLTMPLRVEYLANPAFGINASNEQAGLIIGVVPMVMRLLSIRFWGIFFDRWNFLTIRILINSLFFLSLALFFFTTNLWLMGLANAILGLAFGGGNIMWTLWVTKVAPPEKTSAYMSVHSGLTGARGALAPFIGYFLLRETSPVFAGWTGCLLIGISTILFVPLRRRFLDCSRADDSAA